MASKFRVLRRFNGNGKTYEPGEVAELAGPNLGKLQDLRYVTPVEEPAEETPKRGKSARSE